MLVIALASALTRSVLLPAQHRPQPAANEAVDRGECEPVSMLEVAVPAAQSRVESRNDVSEGVPLVTFRLGADVVAQGHQTLLAYPTLPCFKPVPQKLEPLALDTAVPNMGSGCSVSPFALTQARRRASADCASSRLRHNTTA